MHVVTDPVRLSAERGFRRALAPATGYHEGEAAEGTDPPSS
jgi:hypothetical protein